MAQPLALIGITLTGTGSAQNLVAAIQAIDKTIAAFMATANEVILQGDPGNSTNNVWIGDDQLASGRIGYVLTATGTPLQLRSQRGSDIPLSNFWFMASGGSPKLNVLILP